MYEKASPPLSSARLARFFAWAVLWLMRYACFLVQGGPEAQRHLHRMARAIANLIVVRAARRCPRTAVPALARHPFAAPGFARRALPTPMRCARAPASAHGCAAACAHPMRARDSARCSTRSSIWKRSPDAPPGASRAGSRG